MEAPPNVYQQQIHQLQNLLAQKDTHLDSLGHKQLDTDKAMKELKQRMV